MEQLEGLLHSCSSIPLGHATISPKSGRQRKSPSYYTLHVTLPTSSPSLSLQETTLLFLWHSSGIKNNYFILLFIHSLQIGIPLRPEKDHLLQVKAFSLYKKKYLEEHKGDSVRPARLVLIGSCRNEGDRKIIEQIKSCAQELGVTAQMDLIINAPYEKLCEFLSKAKVGLHSMWNEHFGIGIVELMASGVVTIAHNSGGPKEDIVVEYEGQKTGYLASTPEEYADKIYHVLENFESEEHDKMRVAARKSVHKFSDEEFEKKFLVEIGKILQ